jgi:hypothetical protein
MENATDFNHEAHDFFIQNQFQARQLSGEFCGMLRHDTFRTFRELLAPTQKSIHKFAKKHTYEPKGWQD